MPGASCCLPRQYPQGHNRHMARKIVYIVLGALLIFGLLFLVWTWFFSGSASTSQNNGQFGTASDTNQTGGIQGAGGNGINALGQAGSGQSSANGSISLGGSGAVGAGTNNNNGSINGSANGSNGINNANGSTVGAGSGATIENTGNGSNGSIGGATLQNGTVGANNAGTIGTNGTTNTGTVGTGGISNTGAGNTTNNSGGTLNTGGTVSPTSGSTVSPSGVIWLGGTTFTPADINTLSSDAGGATPIITSNAPGSSGTSLVEALAGTAIAGSLTCGLQAGVAGLATGGVTTAIGGGATAVAAGLVTPPIPGTSPGVQPNVVADYGTRQILAASYGLQAATAAKNTAKDNIPFVQCLVNVIAKTALQQITISVVNWINSGFNGQPSFVTNYQQFFTNVADLAAGQFIQGSGLAFLCSPFAPQIKIAIAQSYANRGAQSCSLTGIIKNVNSFMSGNFAAGGWAGMLSFTTVPTNNPYGAFAYAQIGVANAQSTAVSNANKNISPGGFLGLQQQTCNGQTTIQPLIGQNPQAAMAGNVVQPGCKVTVTTPGTVIQNALFKTEGSGIDQLGIANDLDQIISALTTQLITKTLQNGLTSLSQGTTQTAGDLASQQQAANLLIDMQGRVTIAQQVGTINQGSISDIESAQNNLNTLANCWGFVASSSSAGAAVGTQNAADANTTLQSLNPQIDALNNNITQLNAEIASIDEFEAEVSSAATIADVANVTASYNAAIASGAFASQADVTTAQQNRTTLQSQLATLNMSTAASLAQCQAFGK